MLVALVFVLARNIVKLVVERRRALPFARFRAKLVTVLLGMTLIPAVLVLLVGSELIRNSVDRWFNAPMDEMLTSANAIAGDYYQEQQRLGVGAGAAARARPVVDRPHRRRPGAGAHPGDARRAPGAHRARRGLPHRRRRRSDVAGHPRRRCRRLDAAARVLAGLGRSPRRAHCRRRVRDADERAAAGGRRADSHRGRRSGRRQTAPSAASSSPASTSRASSPRAHAA